MPENSQGLHEDPGALSSATTDKHRAIASIMEELEAIDWYQQRVEATVDGDLAAVLAHNRDEEKEHAAMVIEWLRRHDAVFDQHLRSYLFTTAPITEVEAVVEAEGSGDVEGSTDAEGGAEGSNAEGSNNIDQGGRRDRPTTSADFSLGIGGLRGRG